MPLQTVSVLRPALFLPREEQQRLFENARQQLEIEAYKVLGASQNLVFRGLRPSDLGETNDVWAETIGTTANVYENSQITSQTIPDDTVVVLYGVHDLTDVQFVTSLRIRSGQGVRAEWDLFPIITDDKRLDARTAYALSPIIITKGINVDIQYYVRQGSPQTARGAEIQILGMVAEKSGQIIQP